MIKLNTFGVLRHISLGAVMAVSLAITPLMAADADKGGDYILTTASTGGTYYPVGVAISTLTKIKLQPKKKIGMSAINSAGSGENVKLIRDGEAHFGILQGLYGYYASKGVGPLKEDGKQTHLRSVSMLWKNVEHFVVAADKAKTGTIDDVLALKGEKMAFGKKNSGTLGSNKTILGHLGADIDKDFTLYHAGYGPSADALKNGQVAGVSTPAGAPTGAVTKLMASVADTVKLLEFTDEQLKKADGDFGLWTRYIIKAGTYPNQDKDVKTIAQPNFLAVHENIPEEHVYQITKAMYENLPFLNSIHPATKAMSLDAALAGLPIPLHPGAQRYFEEVGVTIPDNLKAPK